MVAEQREEDEQTSQKRSPALENPISCFMTILVLSTFLSIISSIGFIRLYSFSRLVLIL